MQIQLKGTQLEWGEWCGRPGQQSESGGKMGGKMNILNEKNRFSALKKF
jgi:hypothetical protein